jgi:hypothetical protein
MEDFADFARVMFQQMRLKKNKKLKVWFEDNFKEWKIR